MGPIVGGHTYNVASDTKHYKNLIKARTKCSTIASKVQLIIDSLSSASGNEIDKVRVDLANVKSAFTSVVSSINERLLEIETRALEYDKLYDSFSDKCNRKERITGISYTSNGESTSALFFTSKTDMKHTVDYYYDDVYWQEDGFFNVKIKIVEKIVGRKNENVLSDNMVESDDVEKKVSYNFYKVPYDGKIDLSQVTPVIKSANH